jgi:hypothetical protein
MAHIPSLNSSSDMFLTSQMLHPCRDASYSEQGGLRLSATSGFAPGVPLDSYQRVVESIMSDEQDEEIDDEDFLYAVYPLSPWQNLCNLKRWLCSEYQPSEERVERDTRAMKDLGRKIELGIQSGQPLGKLVVRAAVADIGNQCRATGGPAWFRFKDFVRDLRIKGVPV